MMLYRWRGQIQINSFWSLVCRVLLFYCVLLFRRVIWYRRITHPMARVSWARLVWFGVHRRTFIQKDIDCESKPIHQKVVECLKTLGTTPKRRLTTRAFRIQPRISNAPIMRRVITILLQKIDLSNQRHTHARTRERSSQHK